MTRSLRLLLVLLPAVVAACALSAYDPLLGFDAADAGSAASDRDAGAADAGCAPAANWAAPGEDACCTSCHAAGEACQQNGCFNDYWCNKSICRCAAQPACASADVDAGTTDAPDAGRGTASLGDYCTSDADCEAAYPSCAEYEGAGGGMCTRVCSTDGDCGAGEFCETSDGLCLRPCQSSGDCPEGEDCDFFRSACEPDCQLHPAFCGTGMSCANDPVFGGGWICQ